ncbi:MAG: Uncharacterised protein [Synechococcus sp. MIT S9220]|nr:MAG: Uncharacterised protein [Synechococcus sp. MIT S9220]
MGHIVAIAHIGQRLTLKLAKRFLHGEKVGQGLARMLQIGESVDHRNRGPVGVIGKLLLGIGAHREHIAEATQHSGGVFQGLTAAQLGDLRIEVDGLAAKPGHRHLETHTRACGGFGEDQAQHAVAEINPAVTTLELTCQLKQCRCLLSCGIRRRQEVFAAQC